MFFNKKKNKPQSCKILFSNSVKVSTLTYVALDRYTQKHYTYISNNTHTKHPVESPTI